MQTVGHTSEAEIQDAFRTEGRDALARMLAKRGMGPAREELRQRLEGVTSNHAVGVAADLRALIAGRAAPSGMS